VSDEPLELLVRRFKLGIHQDMVEQPRLLQTNAAPQQWHHGKARKVEL
jgi:hypothetical protein